MTKFVVFIKNSEIRVLRANQLPYGKSMSQAELIQYIAKYVA